jgi:Holliday junction resolvase
MSRGLQRERDLVRKLREEGYWAMRSPASKGCVDVVAIKRDGLRYSDWDASCAIVRFIEVKSTLTPYAHFGPSDREELLEEAEKAGASAELAWWPKNGKLVFIPSSEWP